MSMHAPSPMNGPNRLTSRSSLADGETGLFAKFRTWYGAQKMAAVWGSAGPELDRTIAEWDEALADVHPTLIAAALDQVKRSGSEWPPALPPFLAIIDRIDVDARGRMRQQLRLGDDTAIADRESEAVQGWRREFGRLVRAKTELEARPAPHRPAMAKRVANDPTVAPAEVPAGLPALLSLVAQAAALAGQDEAQVLRTVESRLVAA